MHRSPASDSSVQRPQLIVFDGATGAGKSTLLGHLRGHYSDRVRVGTMWTTRRKRVGDNDWEYRFTDQIPEDFRPSSFTIGGTSYAVDWADLMTTTARGQVYATQCGDRRVLEYLRSGFSTLTLYVYRTFTPAAFEELLVSRGISTGQEAQSRREELMSASQLYLQNMDVYDFVLLNSDTVSLLLAQLTKVLESCGILPDGKLRRDGV